MNAYHELAASYDRLTNDVDYGAIVAFYHQILQNQNVIIEIYSIRFGAFLHKNENSSLQK